MQNSLTTSARILKTAVWAVVLLAPALQAQVEPDGPLIRIDSVVSVPRIAVEPLGRFGVLWDLEGQGAAAFRTFDERGRPLSRKIVVARPGPDRRIFSAALSSDAFGRFLLAWNDRDVYSGETALYVRFYNILGKPLTAPIELDPGVAAEWKEMGGVARSPSGSSVVVWTVLSDRYRIRFQTFDPLQRPLGPTRTARTGPDGGYVADPRAAIDERARFVVAWRELAGGGNRDRFFFQRFGGDGSKQGAPVLLSRNRFISQELALAMGPFGDFTAAWIEKSTWVRASWFDLLGRPLSPQQTVRASEADLSRATVARDRFGNGNAVVVWMRFVAGQGLVVEGRVFDRLGTPLGPVFRVGRGVDPSVGLDDLGGFVVAWAQPGGPGEPRFVPVARRFRLTGSR